MSAPSTWVLASVFLRGLVLQGSWNYNTFQGGGMAYALLPLLRRLHTRPEALDQALERHASHFNAHPYLASLALGSLARMEVDGTDPEKIRRFRSALGGPLGALGDRLVWAAWLPLSSVLALSLHFAGLAPGWVLGVFLLVYNGGHFSMRVMGFREGWRSGASLGARLKGLGLAELAVRLEGWLAGAMGILVGLAVVSPAWSGGADVAWSGVGVAALAAGAVFGPRAWRPTAMVTVGAVALGLVWGIFFV